MKKIFITTIVILTTVLFSCSDKNTHYKQEVIDFLSKEEIRTSSQKEGDLIDISFYTHLPVFTSIGNDSLISTTPDELYNVYNTTYKEKYNSFNMFLSNALNQHIKLNKKDFANLNVSSFLLDAPIRENYKKKGIEEFYTIYCLRKEEHMYLNNNYTTGNQLLSIMYLLSINNNYIKRDDIGGGYLVQNWDKVLKKSDTK